MSRACLDFRLQFQEHLDDVFQTVNKIIRLIQKSPKILLRPPIINMYKSFIRPRHDYGDIISELANNYSFHLKLKSFQYNAVLAITSTIRGTSKEKKLSGAGSLNHFNKGGGTKNFVALLRYRKVNLLLTWSTLFHHLIELIRQEMRIIFLNIRQSIFFFKDFPP